MVQIGEWIEHLAYARNAEAEYRQEIAELEAELAASPLGQRLERLHGFLATAKEDAASNTERIKFDAVQAFGETGTKAPHPAVKIRMTTRLEYDEDMARAWCTGNLPAALKLDKRLFEKHAKAVEETAPTGVVTVTQEPQATISSDLSEYLPDRD